MKKTGLLALFLLIFSLVINACVPLFAPTSAAIREEVVGTAAAGTARAMLTQVMVETLAAKVTELSRPSATPLPPTATETPLPSLTWTASPQPTSTVTFTPTFTPTASPSATPAITSTAVPTVTPLPPTATPIPCNRVQFVMDVSIADGMEFGPGESFTKTWRLKNTGACTWVPNYALVFAGGENMSGPVVLNLDVFVKPGEMVDISVPLKAPMQTGKYTGFWELRSEKGVVFGLGADASQAFWVKITVTNPISNEPGVVADLVKSYCSAEWSSTSENSLPCPGVASSGVGAVYRQSQPVLEGGYQDDETAIVTIPSDGNAGSIMGRYPGVVIKSGYHFKALIGCMNNSPKCNVMMQVNYSANGGAVRNLDSWTQTYDGKFQSISIDLSSLAGKSVQLILTVFNNGNAVDDRAFWLAPRIMEK